MSFFAPQNPGIGGLDELTNAEELFLTTFASLTYSEGDVLSIVSGQVAWAPIGSIGPGISETFETVSKNLDSSNATLNYTGDNLTSVVYATGITKTLNYTGDILISIVLSGSTPSGIDLTKTLSYTGDNLVGITYS